MCAVPNTFVDGTVASASEVNANFTNLENYLGYAEITADVTTVTNGSWVDVTDGSVTVTVPSGGRKIRITAFAYGITSSAVAGTNVYLGIFEGATQKSAGRYNIPASNYMIPMTISYVTTATAGSHTYKLAIFQSAAGTLTLSALSTAPTYISVEQI